MEDGHLNILKLIMTKLIFEGYQFVSIGHVSTIIGDESFEAWLSHMRKFGPMWGTLPET